MTPDPTVPELDRDRGLIALLFAKVSAAVSGLFYQVVSLQGNPQPQRRTLDFQNFTDAGETIPTGQFDFADDSTANTSHVRLLTLYRCSNQSGGTAFTIHGQQSVRFDTGTAWTVTLPTDAEAWDGMRVQIKDATNGAATHNITYQGSGGQTVQAYAAATYGATGVINANGGSVELEYNQATKQYFRVGQT